MGPWDRWVTKQGEELGPVGKEATTRGYSGLMDDYAKDYENNGYRIVGKLEVCRIARIVDHG